MARNRFAQVRYKTLDKCLRNRNRHYNIYDLAEKCSEAIYKIDEEQRPLISTKQIRNDLDFLQSEAGYQADIEKYKLPGDKKTYFRYSNPDFSISHRSFTDQDAERLKQALLTLQRFEGLPHFEWIEEFAARITDLNDLEEEKAVAISFENNSFWNAHHWISHIYQAVISKTPLKIEYAPFDKETEHHLISPYLLKQYNKRWFILCKTEQGPFLTNLALDRIRQIAPNTHQFIPYPGENPEEFFEDIIGVTQNAHEEVQIITLEIEKTLWPYIRTKPIHDSQKSIKATELNDWVTVQLNIKTNYEFYAVVLSHGPRMRIVSPQSCKEKMKTFLTQMTEHYD